MKLLSLSISLLLLTSCSQSLVSNDKIERESYSGIIEKVSNDHFRLNTNPNLKLRLYGAITCQKNQKAVANSGHLKWPCGSVSDALFRSKFEGQFVTCYPQKKLTRKKWFVTCFLGDKDIAAELIKSGWAVVYRTGSVVQKSEYLQYQNDARLQNKGLWNSSFQWPNDYISNGK